MLTRTWPLGQVHYDELDLKFADQLAELPAPLLPPRRIANHQ